MKKHLLILSAVLCSCTLLKAQDQLFKKDNTKLLVKIIEISNDEIKYKMFNNQSGPFYQESKSDFVLIIYENGQQEVINATAPSQVFVNDGLRMGDVPMSQADSISYFMHNNSISLNFLSFFNNEVGLMYQREFYKGQFNIVVPVAFGVDKPSVTQSVFFGSTTNNNSYAYNYNYNSSSFTLDRKLFELGFGINYYPSLRSNLNYYIGPAFRYMQYTATQSGHFYDPNQSSGSSTSVTSSAVLSRYCVSITNGVMLRTRSRININVFGSLGFKNDQLNNKLKNPYDNTEINPISSSFSIYFWSGINVGFSF